MVPHRSHHLRNENLTLLIFPAHDLRQKVEGEPFDRLIAEKIHVVAHFLQIRVFAPRPNGDPESALDTVDEACLLHVLSHPVADADLKGLAKFFTRLLEDLIPLVEDVVVIDDIGVASDVELLVLEEPSRLQMVVGLLVKSGPVADGAVKITDMDVVEVIQWPCPLKLRVVDMELAIGGNPDGLDW